MYLFYRRFYKGPFINDVKQFLGLFGPPCQALYLLELIYLLQYHEFYTHLKLQFRVKFMKTFCSISKYVARNQVKGKILRKWVSATINHVTILLEHQVKAKWLTTMRNIWYFFSLLFAIHCIVNHISILMNIFI